jgi:hypothetical protein
MPSTLRKLPSRLVVDEACISDRGWQAVDLARLQAVLHVDAAERRVTAMYGTALLPASPAASAAPRGQLLPFRPRKRVVLIPPASVVVIGREPAPPRPACPVANDNASAPVVGGSVRSAWRDALLLVLLAATVAGAFYSGRLHAYQKVIVVPPPASASNAVT